jgi:hypothetical protein
MTTADEYQQYAEECVRAASEAETEKERKAFLDMARAWTQAALRIEGVLVPIEQNKPEPKIH